jgi:hypothetical protein
LLRDPLRKEFQQWLGERLRGTVPERATARYPDDEAGSPGESGDADEAFEEAVLAYGGGVDTGSVPFQADVQPDDIFRLIRDPGQVAFKLTFDLEPSVENDQAKERLSRAVVVSLLPTLLEGVAADDLTAVFEAGLKLFDGGWNRCMGLLLCRLSVTDSPQVALDTARDIWGDPLPPLVAATLIDAAPPSERKTLLDGALAAASGADNLAQRAAVLTFLLPHLEPSASTQPIADLAVMLEQMEPHAVSTLLGQLDVETLPPAALLPFVQRLLRSATSRRDLFPSLQRMLPALKRLGSASTIRSLPQAIRDAIACVR